MPTDPPSYQPKGPRAPRPDSASARPVGEETPPTRIMPAGNPPSYAPGGGQSQTPAAAPTYRPQPHPSPAPEGGGFGGIAPPPSNSVQPAPRPRKKRSRGKTGLFVFAVVLVLLLAWPIGLLVWANGKLHHVDALSDAANTPGTTYLLAGSDSRADLDEDDSAFDRTAGARTDTILLLHVPEEGKSSLVSLPRDSYVAIPGHDSSKLNAAYSWGGPELLVETVENLSGLTIDHYVEVGFSGITNIVEELGGVELCYDEDVSDEKSQLEWEAGCHMADGDTALAFARMRYADKEGDIGRTNRQRQIIAAITSEAITPGTIVNPGKQVGLLRAATGSLVVDEETGIVDLARLALAFRKATGADGWSGTPPIASLNYRPGGVGSAVQLDEEQLPDFFAQVTAGTPPPQEN